LLPSVICRYLLTKMKTLFTREHHVLCDNYDNPTIIFMRFGLAQHQLAKREAVIFTTFLFSAWQNLHRLRLYENMFQLVVSCKNSNSNELKKKIDDFIKDEIENGRFISTFDIYSGRAKTHIPDMDINKKYKKFDEDDAAKRLTFFLESESGLSLEEKAMCFGGLVKLLMEKFWNEIEMIRINESEDF